MSVGKNLQQFLAYKISDMKIKKKDFIMKCGINQPIFNKILNGTLSNPRVATLTKLADYFQVSLDEVFGRDPKYYNSKPKLFVPIDHHAITKNLTSIVKTTMKEHDLSPIQLSLKIGMSDRTLKMFLDPNVSATPGAATTLALANFLDASIDDMIGRRPPTRAQEQKLDIPKQLSSLYKQDLEKLSEIKHSVKSSTPQDQNIKKATSTKHLNKHKDAGRSR